MLMKERRIMPEEVNRKDINGDTPLTLAVRDMIVSNNPFAKIEILLDFIKIQEIERKTFDDAFDVYEKEVRPILKERYMEKNIVFDDDILSDFKSDSRYTEMNMPEEERKAIIDERKRKVKEEREAIRKKEREYEDFIEKNPCKSDELRNGGRGHCTPEMNCQWCSVPEKKRKFAFEY